MQRNKVIINDLTEIIPSKEKISAVEWLAEQMPGGFFIYRADETGELLYVNKSTCEIFGCESVEEFRELTGNTFKGMVHPDDFASTQTSIDDQIANKDNRRSIDYVVYRIIRKDGAVRWVDDYGHYASLPGYGPVYYVFIEDITQTRIAAEEQEKAKNLAEALEIAEHANAAKSAFLSNMSHEIRTPITAILGMNEMIQRETDDSVILDYSENIRKAGVSLLGIISDILDFSKIEKGKMELDNEEYSLTSLIVDLYNLVQLRTEAKGLNLKFNIDRALPVHLYGDEIRVKQIITNLLTNAVKYTEKGSVEFDISLQEKTEDSVSFMVSVTDTGIGIKKEDMEKLFEPFNRLDLKKTRTIEGSGLGLTITMQMLALMGSELKVESTYGEGSKFYFVLTQKVSDWTEIGDFSPEVQAHGKPDSRRKHSLFTAPGMKLLIVDDTPMNLQVIAGLLRRTRMHIDTATSGAECIRKFGQEHYDLVFLDYRMPQMNGIETLAELRRIYPELASTTPIISLTASAVSGDREKLLNAGFTDYLTKPVNIDEMEHMMIKYLPSDSVILGGDNGEQEDDELSKLPDIIFDYPQIDPQKGIEYCGDAEDYIFAIETYSVSVDAKAEQIENDLNEGNFENYTLNVHSLKSTSGAIGAMSLFEKAKALEQAGKCKDMDTLKRDTPDMLREYRQLKGILKKVLDHYQGTDESSRSTIAAVEEERSKMLSRALEEAERANLAKTAMLSDMSYEIRTPMNAIMGLYNIALKKTDIDDETRSILTRIGTSAKHLLALINNIFDMSLIESGHVKLKNEEFSFGSMLEQINTMTEAQCIDKDLVFECIINGEVDDCYIGDDMKLKQLLINILSNAVKYTPSSGKVTFTVEEKERHDDRAELKFVIADTGVGIDEAYLPMIFEPFTKEITDDGSGYGGTGLGMAITKNIVDMMCGEIEVTSKAGQGSTFTVLIPLGLAKAEGEKEDVFDPESVMALVVDDDDTACKHAGTVLSRVGIKADFASGGEEALLKIRSQNAQQKPYQIILIDWKMPGMDGIELIRRIRENTENDDAALVLTTYNWDEIMEEALEAGVDGFIAKPLFAGNIREELLRILTDKKTSAHRDKEKIGLAGRRVLLAEDMEINAQIMAQVLGLKAVRADIAFDGDDTVKRFEDSPPGYYDAILMDIRMPKLNGLDATRKIRSLERSDACSIPIIALTANAFEEDVKRSLEAGMNAHLSKPVEPDALFQTLERVIGDKKNSK